METNGPTGLLGLVAQKMTYLNQRQAVLAENVANADTPQYQARDLAPFTFGDAMKQANIGMSVTHAGHIIPASMAGVNAKTIKTKNNEILPSGNSVDLETEMMKVSQTSVDYQEATSIYKKLIGMFHIALKGGAS